MGKKVIGVMGYGCEITPEVLGYLQQVARFAEENDIAAVILSGGFTSKLRFPGVSEASMMKGKLLMMGVKAPIILDEASITTLGNIRGVKEALEELKGDVELVIFCDDSRALKVLLISRIVLGWFPKLRRVEITKKFFSKLKQVLVATPLDVLATLSPKIELLQLKRKELIIEKS